ncbi:MAG: DUF861 domain-containing protein [Clostridia bacterium]|nr:DUF861 domain-containing protein [Clostridia bacterium]
MKKLVCAEVVKAAAEKGQKTISLECNTLITPAARDLAKELGVEFVTGSSAGEKGRCQNNVFQKNETLKNIDRDLIYQIVKVILSNNLLQNAADLPSYKPFCIDGDPESGLKIVRGRTVKFAPLYPGDTNKKVACCDVAKEENGQMRAGFLTMEKSCFDGDLGNDEINVILEGSMSVNINGNTFEVCQGDVLLIPKGSKVTRSSSGYVKLFYVTGNRANLMVHQ